MNSEHVKLYFKEGSSDKVYEVYMDFNLTGWDVTFAYGRRGNAMQTGSKTAHPIAAYADAKKIYDKLVQSKLSSGYKIESGGGEVTEFVKEETGGADSGVRMQLLNEIEEEELEQYFTDGAYCAQEKHDGRRRALIKNGCKSSGTNKKGALVPLITEYAKDLYLMDDDHIVFDSEDMGAVAYVFDLIEATPSHVKDWKAAPYRERLRELTVLFRLHKFQNIKLVETAFTTAEKREMFAKLKKNNAEGIVFKRLDAPRTAGRPNSGGPQLKFKFRKTASVIVQSLTAGKRSVAMMLNDGTFIGRVTIPPNKSTPRIGDVIEVEYLYAFKGGSLFQPVYLGVRDDTDPDECVEKQLKYKREE